MKLFNFKPFWLLSLVCNSLVAQPSGVSDLVITEIMADPDPSFGLPVAEYIEIYNRTTYQVDLTGWKIFDGSLRSLPGMMILPGEYIVVCSNSDTSLFQLYGVVAGVSSLSLTNGGEKLALIDDSGTTIDSVIYSNTWYGSSYKADGGWSLERIDKNYLCFDAANWQPSTNPQGGTPGAENSVNGLFIDNDPPVLIRSYCDDSSSVTLLFNEGVDEQTASVVSNYNISNGVGIISVDYSNAFPEKIKLNFSAALVPNKIYFVGVNGISDCSGNVIQANSFSKFGIADTGFNYDVVINEILFNPYPDGTDFIELYNRGTGIYDLSAYKLASVNSITNEIESIQPISGEVLLLFPGDYIVLTESINKVTDFYHSSYPNNFYETDDLPAMNNDEGYIALIKNGVRADALKYNEDFHFKLLQDVEGVSLEKINPFRNSMDPSAWHSAATAVGYATPGFQNSVYSSNSETDKPVTVEPEIFSPDQDGRDDVITFSVKSGSYGYVANLRIYNASGQVIYSLDKNRLLATTDAFTWDGVNDSGIISPPGIYVALLEIFNLNGNVKHYKLPFVLAVKL